MFNRVGNAPRDQPARNARGGAQRSPRPSGEAEDWRVLQRAQGERAGISNVQFGMANVEGGAETTNYTSTEKEIRAIRGLLFSSLLRS